MGGGQNQERQYAEGLCEHHPEHTIRLICGFIVDEDKTASDSDAIASGSDAEHTHTQECYAPDCPYEWGEHQGSSLLDKTITGWTFTDAENLTEGELALPGVTEERQADFDTVVSMLPTQIEAELEGETEPAIVDITGWSCPDFIKGADGNWPLTGEYTFTAELPEGYTCAPLPAVKILVGGAKLYAGTLTGDFTVEGGALGTNYTYENNILTIKDGAVLTISGTTTADRIVVDHNAIATITLAGVDIDRSSGSDGHCAFDMTGASVTLILAAGTVNNLKSGVSEPGLKVPEGATLIIEGEGGLIVKGSGGPGIGGSSRYPYEGDGDNAGEILIKGSVSVTATSNASSGIGGGNGFHVPGGNSARGGNGGKVTIEGKAVVIAEGADGAGIGGGSGGSGGAGGAGGTVLIQGEADVTARSNKGAGIGGGGGGKGDTDETGGTGGNGGKVTIQENANVWAASTEAAGIGGGNGDNGGGSSIGDLLNGGGDGGTGGAGGEVNIYDEAVVTAEGGRGAGIGGGGCGYAYSQGRSDGAGGAGEHVTIQGNVQVTARSNRGADIGGGDGGDFHQQIVLGDGGELAVTGGATVTMRNNGTNAGIKEYKNCTIIDKDNNSVQYSEDGRVTPTLMLKASPEGSQTLTEEVTLTVTLSGAVSGDSGRKIIFTVGNIQYSESTDNDGNATCEIKNLQAGTYTFYATFEGDNKNAPVTAQIKDYKIKLKAQTGFAIIDPGAKTYGDSDFSLQTTGGQSTGDVSFSAPSGNGVLTVTSDGKASILGEGKVIVTAVKAGDSVYDQIRTTQEITVAPRDISHVTVNVTGSRVYTGSQLKPAFSVEDGSISITDGDYTVSYGANMDAGTDAGSVVLTGRRNYTGTKTVTFGIEKRLLEGAAVTLESTSYTYTGGEIKPAVTGVVVDGITVPASAYDVGYADHTAVGTGTVTVTAKADSNFSGTAGAAFEIKKQEVTPSDDDSDSSSSDSSGYNPNILRGTWIRTDAGIWMFRLTGGDYARSRWGLIDGLWYYFDSEGKMLTGWQLINNRWYYLCTEEVSKQAAGRKEGAMLTGWYYDPVRGGWFYLDTGGAMVTGWKEIGGKWYYFYENGVMAADTEVGGYVLGPDGVWKA